MERPGGGRHIEGISYRCNILVLQKKEEEEILIWLILDQSSLGYAGVYYILCTFIIDMRFY